MMNALFQHQTRFNKKLRYSSRIQFMLDKADFINPHVDDTLEQLTSKIPTQYPPENFDEVGPEGVNLLEEHMRRPKFTLK